MSDKIKKLLTTEQADEFMTYLQDEVIKLEKENQSLKLLEDNYNKRDKTNLEKIAKLEKELTNSKLYAERLENQIQGEPDY